MSQFKNEIYNETLNRNLYFYLLSLPLAITLIISLFILIFFQFLPPKLPLFYSLPWGNAQLANHQQFFIIPASIVLINLINLLIIWHLHPSQVFFKKMLTVSSLVITLIFLTTFIKIFFIFA